VAHNFYPGTRWTGLWDNPNIYGMLMGAGVTLTIGLLAASPKVQSPRSKVGGICGRKHSQGLAEFVSSEYFFLLQRG